MALVPVLLAVAMIIVVPLGLSVWSFGTDRVPQTAIALGAVASSGLLLPPSLAGVALALPWLGLASWWLAKTIRLVAADLRQTPGTSDHRKVDIVGTAAALAIPAFWLVGAVFLILDRMNVDPLGVGGQIITLTAVHFHYAGFASTVVLATTRQRLRHACAHPAHSAPEPWRLAASDIAVSGILLGPPLVAVGFAFLPVAQILGAVTITLALWSWSVAAGGVPMSPDVLDTILWRVARISVFVGMFLATWWAIGSVAGLAAPSIPTMAMTHGVIQGLCFATSALYSLHRLRHHPSSPATAADLMLVRGGLSPGSLAPSN